MLHIPLRITGLVILCMAVFVLCGCEASFVPLFEYDNSNVFLFDSEGKVIRFTDFIPSGGSASFEVKMKITPRGEYEITDGDFISRGAPGDRVFPVFENREKLYLLTEKGTDWMHVLEWDRERKKIRLYPGGNREACGIVGKDKLCGIQYMGDTFRQEYFDPAFGEMERRLRVHYRTENLRWAGNSPDGKQWIAELFFLEKPSVYVLCDIEAGRWHELSDESPYEADLSQKKEVFRFTAGDGAEISGILSFPPARFGRRRLPLIVFPHGGPQSRSMLSFDPRVEQLTRNGFLVFQPNYRGSTGQGKKFRQDGWGVRGIRRSLADIAEGTTALIREGFADPERTAILGGSWGAYCALESAVLYPTLYRAVIAFFGPSDLCAMLHEFLPKSGANSCLDRLQYGNVEDPAAAEALKNISPFFSAESIRAPVLLYHFEQDDVISFGQSERFFEKMKSLGKKIVFIRGVGKHGFPEPSAEAAAYERAVRFLNESFRE